MHFYIKQVSGPLAAISDTQLGGPIPWSQHCHYVWQCSSPTVNYNGISSVASLNPLASACEVLSTQPINNC